MLVLAVALAAAGACSDAPSAETSAAGSGKTSDLSVIEQTLQNLDGAARTERLAEVARAETAVATLYTSMTLDDAEVVIDAFRERHGVDVELFRASSDKVLLRLVQEAEAGFSGADVILTGALELEVLSDEQLILPLTTPATAGILGDAVFPTWAGVYLQTFVATWNSNLLDPADVPKTWEDVLTQYPTGLVLELGDFDWFATLVQKHFVGELGYTETDAIDLFRQAAGVATIVDGHTLMAELLAAGEFNLATSAYHARVGRLIADGAPISWEPAVEPLVVRPNGVAIARDTDAPATELLFAEYLLTEAQPLLAELGRTPADTSTPGGLPAAYTVKTVDVETLTRDRAKWESLYASIVELSGDSGAEN